MTEQQPVEGTPATPTAPEGQAQTAPESQTAPATRTAEQVEAEYKARLSGKDKAHAAEVATLQAQVKAAQGSQTTATSQAEAASGDVDTLKKQLADAQNFNKQQAQDFALQTRQQKYPQAAEALDAQTLATMDEAKLSGLNARLTPDVPSAPTVPVDPNTPQGATPPKPSNEKTVAELKADLLKESAGFAAQINTRE